MNDNSLFRRNIRVGPHHLAYLADRTRNGNGLIRKLLDDEIEDSEYDLERLKEASTAFAEAHDGDRKAFSQINSTDEVLEFHQETEEA